MMRRRALLAASQTGGDFKPIIDINNYLTIEALEDGLTASLSVNACEYCVDGGDDWKSLAAGTATESINSGQTLSFRQNIWGGGSTPTNANGIGTFTISKKCNLKGNCMSMLYGDRANEYTTTNWDYAFKKLFYNCKNIVNVSSNFLPATFLSQFCYESIFEGCTSLTTAPVLPATTTVYGCYLSMFSNCISLTTAPELLAKSLKYWCYEGMFYGCSKLNYIKALFTTTPNSVYTDNWVYGVAASGTFVKNKNATWDVTGASGIPSRWTIQTV